MGEKHERPTREELEQSVKTLEHEIWGPRDTEKCKTCGNEKVEPQPCRGCVMVPYVSNGVSGIFFAPCPEFGLVCAPCPEYLPNDPPKSKWPPEIVEKVEKVRAWLRDIDKVIRDESKNARTPEPIWKAIVRLGEEAAQKEKLTPPFRKGVGYVFLSSGKA